ncbi:MAG: hypothetical protein H6925_00315 [Holosporaceae bacterium]|nr:MAG: hypothetical protein H6925_00315 [Holosporaceae bacterium]
MRIAKMGIGDVACPMSLGILDTSPLQKKGYGSMALETLLKHFVNRLIFPIHCPYI